MRYLVWSVSVGFLSMNVYADLTTQLEKPLAIQNPSAKSMAPTKELVPEPGTTKNPQTSPTTPGDKNQAVNDQDINRFTNTIVSIKDFYAEPIGDKSIRLMP